MLDAQFATSAAKASRNSAAAIFQREWRLYRIIVDHNYLFHREACGRLRQVLLKGAARPFRFLDLACGDASATAGALKGMEIASYCGVDLSADALDLAGAALADVDCPISLHEGDFVEALADWAEPVDVIWVGLSLHHLRAPAKLRRCAPPAGCSTGAGCCWLTKTPARTARIAPGGSSAGIGRSAVGARLPPRNGAGSGLMSGPMIIRRPCRAGANSAAKPGSERFGYTLSRRLTCSVCSRFSPD